MSRWQMASPGNWMHLQYQSRLQARKALSKDGKVFGDAIMVGVKPCIDKVGSAVHVWFAFRKTSSFVDIKTGFCRPSAERDGQQQHGRRLPSTHPLFCAPRHPSLSHETTHCGLQELWERLPGDAHCKLERDRQIEREIER